MDVRSPIYPIVIMESVIEKISIRINRMLNKNSITNLNITKYFENLHCIGFRKPMRPMKLYIIKYFKDLYFEGLCNIIL